MTLVDRNGLNSSVLTARSGASGLEEAGQNDTGIGNLSGIEVKKTSSWGIAGRALLAVVTVGGSEIYRGISAWRSSRPPQARVSELDDMMRGGLGEISLEPVRSQKLRKLDAMSETAIRALTADQIAAMDDDEKAAIGVLFGNRDRLSFGDFAGQRVDVWLLNLKRQLGEPIHPSAASPATAPTAQTAKPTGGKAGPTGVALTDVTKSNLAFDGEIKISLEQVRADVRDGHFESARKGCDEAIAKIATEYGKSDLRLWDFKQILAQSFEAEGNKLDMIHTLSEMSELVDANAGKPGNSEKAGYTFNAWATYSKQNGHASQYEKYTNLALKAFEADLAERDGGNTRETKKNVATLNHRVANQLGRKGDFGPGIRHAETAYRMRLEEYGQFDARTERSAALVQGLKTAKMEAFLAEADDESGVEAPALEAPASSALHAKGRIETFLADDAALDREDAFKPVPIGIPRGGFPNVTGNSCFMNSTIKSVIASSGLALDAYLDELDASGTLGDRAPALNAFRNLVQASRSDITVSNALLETFQNEMLALKKPDGSTLLSDPDYFNIQQDANDFREVLNDTFGLDRLPGQSFEIVQTANRDGLLLAPTTLSGAGFTLAPRDNDLQRLAASNSQPVPLARYQGTIEGLVKEAMGEQLGELAGDVYRTTRTDFQGDWSRVERIPMRLAQGDGQHYFDFRPVDFDAGFKIQAMDTKSTSQHDLFLQPSEVVCHSGTDGAGHYFTYTKAPDGNGWWLHNDSQVSWTPTIPDPSLSDVAFRPVSINFAVTDLGQSI